MGLRSRFHEEAIGVINSCHYDLLWIIHEETACEFMNDLVGRKYLLSLYELNDHRMALLEKLRPIAKNALEVLVPDGFGTAALVLLPDLWNPLG